MSSDTDRNEAESTRREPTVDEILAEEFAAYRAEQRGMEAPEARESADRDAEPGPEPAQMSKPPIDNGDDDFFIRAR